MRRFARSLICLILLQGIAACGGGDEAEKQRQIQLQIDVIERQVQKVGEGRARLQDQMGDLQIKLDAMSVELEKKGARLTATRSANAYLNELLTVGFGESPGRWALENSSFSTNLLLFLAFCVLLIWLGWRIRLRSMETETATRMNRVIDDISRRESRTGKKQETPAPAAEKIPEQKTPPEPEKPEEKRALEDERKKPAGPETKAADKTENKEKDDPADKKIAVQGETKPPAPAKNAAAKVKKATPKSKARPVKKAAGKKAEKEGAKKLSKKRVVRRTPAKKCRVKGCQNKHRSKGYCNKHYQQWRRGTLTEETED